MWLPYLHHTSALGVFPVNQDGRGHDPEDEIPAASPWVDICFNGFTRSFNHTGWERASGQLIGTKPPLHRPLVRRSRNLDSVIRSKRRTWQSSASRRCPAFANGTIESMYPSLATRLATSLVLTFPDRRHQSHTPFPRVHHVRHLRAP